jgi:Spy/CpxP family protein refolding chaperone
MIRATLTTLALLAPPLCAQPAPPPMPGPGGEAMPGHGPDARQHHGPDQILRHLGLSADQEKAVHAALDRHRPAAMAREQEARDLEDRLHAAVEDPAVGEAQLRAAHAAASAAHLAALLEQRTLVADLDALLTPEQRAKAARIRTNLERERQARRAVQEDLGGPGTDRPEPPPMPTPR